MWSCMWVRGEGGGNVYVCNFFFFFLSWKSYLLRWFQWSKLKFIFQPQIFCGEKADFMFEMPIGAHSVAELCRELAAIHELALLPDSRWMSPEAWRLEIYNSKFVMVSSTNEHFLWGELACVGLVVKFVPSKNPCACHNGMASVDLVVRSTCYI